MVGMFVIGLFFVAGLSWVAYEIWLHRKQRKFDERDDNYAEP